jgi:hypothetical protein
MNRKIDDPLFLGLALRSTKYLSAKITQFLFNQKIKLNMRSVTYHQPHLNHLLLKKLIFAAR